MRFIHLLQRNKRLALVLLIPVILGYLVYQRQAVQRDESIRATQGIIRDELVLSGEIDADEHVTLSFQTSGLLAWVGVKENDRVKKYQAIASLDVRHLKKILEKELNNYLAIRWDLEQTREDYEGKIVTDKIKRILEKVQFDLNNTVIDVELQDLAVELAAITTPISGIVTRISHPFPGVNVTPTTAQFEIFNPDTYSFRVTADQTEVVSLTEGMPVTVMLDAYPQASITATIARISYQPRLDETGTIYDIWLAFSTLPANPIRLGMTGDARFIITEKTDAILLPSRFVKADEAGQYVITDRKKKRRVETGIETDADTEILQGLEPGEVVYD